MSKKQIIIILLTVFLLFSALYALENIFSGYFEYKYETADNCAIQCFTKYNSSESVSAIYQNEWIKGALSCFNHRYIEDNISLMKVVHTLSSCQSNESLTFGLWKSPPRVKNCVCIDGENIEVFQE